MEDRISTARSSAEEAARGASQFKAGQFTIGEQLKQTVSSLFDFNRDLIEPKNQALETFFNAPSAAVSNFGTQFAEGGQLNPNFILNPNRQNQAIQQAINSAFTPFSTLQELLGMRQGNIADIIRAGTGAFGAQASFAQSEANLTQRTLQDLIGESQFDRSLSQQLQISREGRAGRQPRRQVVDVGDRRVIIDLDTGEIIEDLGPIPTDGTAGNIKTVEFNNELFLLDPQTGDLKPAFPDEGGGLFDFLGGAARGIGGVARGIGGAIGNFFGGGGNQPQLGGTIRVREISSGQTGTIPENEFDPKLHERL